MISRWKISSVENLVPVGFENTGLQVFLTIGARRVTDHAFFFAQLIFNQQRVFPVKRCAACHRPDPL